MQDRYKAMSVAAGSGCCSCLTITCAACRAGVMVVVVMVVVVVADVVVADVERAQFNEQQLDLQVTDSKKLITPRTPRIITELFF